MYIRKQVIVITDGDQMAYNAAREAAGAISASVVAASAGNPTPISGPRLVEAIREQRAELVIVLCDDNGNEARGPGERAIRSVLRHPDFNVLGALAVASGRVGGESLIVHFSIDRYGSKVFDGVDKEGKRLYLPYPMIWGDTLGVLRTARLPCVIGVGDVGKMNGYDAPPYGSRVTRLAVCEMLAAHGEWPEPLPWRDGGVYEEASPMI